MTLKETEYRVSLSGGKVTVKDELVSEEVARKIINLIMGGTVSMPGTNNSGDHDVSEKEVNIESMSPKAFMALRKPSSEIERIVCLAYYLNHNRSIGAFKTKDLTKLNTEAAQPSFSNPTVFARNAETAGYLAKAGGGSKQISDLGEKLVNALPDREKVKEVLADYRASKARRPKKTRKTTK